MANTLVGVYDDYSQAQNAMNELVSCGIDRSAMQLTPEETSSTARDTSLRGDTTDNTAADTDDHSFGAGVRHFFHHLFGGDDATREHADIYSEAVRRGHYLLTINVRDDQQSEQAMQVMNRYNPVDIDERAAEWKSRGWNQYDASAPTYTDEEIAQERRDFGRGGATEGTTIPVIQEDVQVGKREVERGGVRVYQRVKETPVEESVQLREEHVNVERRPVNQPASEADLAAMKEGTFEVRETAEEAVVGKTARVVEEVVIGKDTSERTAQINDTVRRTDVEVEQLGGRDSSRDMSRDPAGMNAATAMGSNNTANYDDEYRRHWETTYGRDGGEYGDYAQAYRYGSTVADDERYRGYRWDDAEPRMRQDWESSHAGHPWERVKDAVRYGWEKVTH